MGEILRRIPTGVEADESLDYSFAVEYHGPPVSYEIPRAVPIDVERIPTAAVVSEASISDCRSLPIIQPLWPTDPLKLRKGPALRSDSIVSPTSVFAYNRDGGKSSSEIGSSGPFGFSDGHEESLESSPEIDSSGVLGFSGGPDQLCVSCSEIDTSGVLGFSNGEDLSCELSGEIGTSKGLNFSGVLDVSHGSHPGIDSSSVLCFSNDRVHSSELSGEIGNSGTAVFSDVCDRSRDLSEEYDNAVALDSFNDSEVSVDLSNDINGPNWIRNESGMSSPFVPSDHSSRKFVDCQYVPSIHVQKVSHAAFINSGSHVGGTIETEFTTNDNELIDKQEALSKARKGSCHRCFKGSRFTEKEACIVCNAKYCSSCVLRAMGSMPEGRKCVTCIGYPVDERKRETLGKCSRMLKRLLSPLEIQSVMKAEKSCEANQLQPEYVIVNGKQLCQDEMVLLHSCPVPPSKLKPGRYWYDKVSGFWGKEGQKPCKIISPNLNVGGELMVDASKGNTGVFINNREIKKSELKMLQWAGVHCAGNTHFWLHSDGSFLEEGQNNVRVKLWGNTRMRLICSFWALPFPKSSGSVLGEEVNDRASRNMPDFLEHRTLHKLLLVGCDGSGTSAIFKQAKFLYQDAPFDEELENIKYMIQSNVYKYLGILLEGREQFEEEYLTEIRNKRSLDESSSSGDAGEGDSQNQNIYSISPKLKVFSNMLLTEMMSGNLEAMFPAATREYSPLVEELWKHPAFQATFSRRNELQTLPSCASYFLERMVDISKAEYEPCDKDILYAEGITSSNGLAHTVFLFPQSTNDSALDDVDKHDPKMRYELIRLQVKGLGENCKWLERFEDVRAVIFCVALSDYDQLCDDGSGMLTNKMLVSRKVFERIVVHPIFEQVDFLLILNKFDLLEEKIERIPLTVCEWFDDFNPVTSRHRPNSSRNSGNDSMGQKAFHHIAVKFKRLYASHTGRKLYVSQTNALDKESVDRALRYAREILRWEEDKQVFSITDDYSVHSTEDSPFASVADWS